MRVKSLLGMVIVALVAVAFVVLKPSPYTPSEAAVLPFVEKPWLSREAADQILGPWGSPGPLFAGVTLGGPAPAAEIREQIAAFARAHDVTIEFDVVDDELVAIRFDVTFGGCCGYEGVDGLAARIGRPNNGGGCGTPKFFYDNWAIAHEDGTHVRATVRVNRLSLRWERGVSLDDVITHAERVLGTDRGAVGEAAGDRWIEIEAGKRYLLELPYAFINRSWQPARSRPDERGITLTTDRRIVTDATFSTSEDRSRLKARWGKPRVSGVDDEVWTWYRGDRTIIATFEIEKATVTISRR